jgi:TRAP-type C4-dicarboxylate transport system substrate-binding protein
MEFLRMKRQLISLAAVAACCTALPAAAQTVLTLSSWVPPTHALTIAQAEWCDLVSKNSGGKIRCNQLPRAVSAPPGTLDAVKNGLADVSFTVHGYTPGRFVFTQMAEFSFLGDTAEPLSVAYNKVAMKYPQFLQEHQGVHVIAFFTHGPGIVFNTKRPITKAEDLQGLKWRVGGGMVNEITKTLNMNVTLKPAPESYELLSGGVMDGTLFPAESTESFKIDKVIKHATFFPGGLYNTSFVLLMNKDKYDKLAPDEKKAVDAASGEVAARIIGRNWDKVDRRGIALMQANNVQMVKADAKFVAEVKSRTSQLEAKWAKDAEAKGLKDAAKVLAEFRSEIAKASK